MCLLRKIKNIKIENSAKKFGGIKKSGYLCNAKAETLIEILAKIAQLVEHDLAKVGVAGSSPVFRSARLRALGVLELGIGDGWRFHPVCVANRWFCRRVACVFYVNRIGIVLSFLKREVGNERKFL